MIPLGNAYLWEIANEFAIAQKRQWAGEMSMEALDAWQSKNLQRTIKYCQDKSPFYQHHLAGLEATSPIDDLPFTAKDDLRQYLDDVASLGLDRAWVYYESTGTTGISTPCPRTAEDSVRTGVALCEGYRDLLKGHGEHLSIAVMGPTELHSTGDTFGDVFRSLGHSSIKMWPHSPVVGFDRASHLLQRLPITGLTEWVPESFQIVDILICDDVEECRRQSMEVPADLLKSARNLSTTLEDPSCKNINLSGKRSVYKSVGLAVLDVAASAFLVEQLQP